MSHLSFLISLSILFISSTVFSQKRWDGGGGNNDWYTSTNWTTNNFPVVSDNVILDNSIVPTSYSVVLPPILTTVKSITITPSANRTIELILPATNTVVPGLVVNGPGFGLIINSGGIFRNSSGAASGNAVKISDSIKINNDGKYIHNTSSGHASNVQLISRASGTEKGILELDIPTASSTISLSGRTFGKLILKSAAAGGSCNYTAAGTTRTLIRNNLELGSGVNLSLNFFDTIFVLGDLSQGSGTINMGSSIKSVVLYVGQNLTQAVGGVFTESGVTNQKLELGGSGNHVVNMSGTILNQVALVKSGAGTALLKTPVSLPYKLSLKGGRIVTTDAWSLTLQSACTIEADTLAGTGFVDGPLIKQGLNNSGFLFPVGKSNQMRWIRLENATGNFTVEYFNSNPVSISGNLGSGLHHISTVEYWDVQTSGTSNAQIKLSFKDPNSGGVTDLSSLRVARLESGTWQNAGNINYSGNPGTNGWVSSSTAVGFSAVNKSFALAGAIAQENPLPFLNIPFSASRLGQKIILNWKVENSLKPAFFEIQESEDGKLFSTVSVVKAIDGEENYYYEYHTMHVGKYYRLRFRMNDNYVWYESRAVRMNVGAREGYSIEGSNLVNGSIHLSVTTNHRQYLYFTICNMAGVVQKVVKTDVFKGSSLLKLDVKEMKSGLYFLSESSGAMAKKVLRFIRM